MKELLVLNPEGVSQEEADSYPVREAARAVVVDGEGKLALLHVSKKNYYKLPGGGLEHGEDKLLALARECKEEIGCEVEVLKEIGIVFEHRKIFSLKQISYCYTAKVKSDKCEPEFTDKEKADGFQVVWLSYSEALEALGTSKATDVEGSAYIVPRDLGILNAVKNEFAL